MFQEVLEAVLELFVDKHTEIIKPVHPNWKLDEYKIERGMITKMLLRNYYGYYHVNDFIFTCDNHTDPLNIEITYEATNLSGMTFSHIFPRNKFDIETEGLYIEYILNAHLQFLEENKEVLNNFLI